VRHEEASISLQKRKKACMTRGGGKKTAVRRLRKKRPLSHKKKKRGRKKGKKENLCLSTGRKRPPRGGKKEDRVVIQEKKKARFRNKEEGMSSFLGSRSSHPQKSEPRRKREEKKGRNSIIGQGTASSSEKGRGPYWPSLSQQGEGGPPFVKEECLNGEVGKQEERARSRTGRRKRFFGKKGVPRHDERGGVIQSTSVFSSQKGKILTTRRGRSGPQRYSMYNPRQWEEGGNLDVLLSRKKGKSPR